MVHQPHFRAITDAIRFRAAMEALLAHVESDAAGDARGVHALEELLLQINEQQPVSVSRGRWKVRFATGSSGFACIPPCRGIWQTEARRMAVSTVHLRRIVKQMTGLPPGQFITRRGWMWQRKCCARHRCDWGDCRPDGLGNIAYFSRIFRRHYASRLLLTVKSPVVISVWRASSSLTVSVHAAK
jgi:AraC-like DNA-binding protein